MSDRRRRHLEPTAPLPVAVVIVYKSLGKLLPERYDPDRRSLRWTMDYLYSEKKQVLVSEQAQTYAPLCVDIRPFVRQ